MKEGITEKGERKREEEEKENEGKKEVERRKRKGETSPPKLTFLATPLRPLLQRSR